MKLAEALDLRKGDIVAFVGAGGKTSALIALGAELSACGWRALATTTTRLGRAQLELMSASLSYHQDSSHISQLLDSERFLFLYDRICADKVYGFEADRIEQILASLTCDICLIEADGARMLPLKAPKSHEPAIPACATLVVPIVSLAVLGKSLDENHVYNAGALAGHYGFARGRPVKPEWIARMLGDEAMLLKNIPAHARVVALLNQAPRAGEMLDQANLIAERIMNAPESPGRHNVDRIVIGSVQDADPIHTLHTG